MTRIEKESIVNELTTAFADQGAVIVCNYKGMTLEALEGVKTVFVPEFNVVGQLDKEVRTALYGKSDADVVGAPRVAGGMSMPAEAILKEVMEKLNPGKGA